MLSYNISNRLQNGSDENLTGLHRTGQTSKNDPNANPNPNPNPRVKVVYFTPRLYRGLKTDVPTLR